MVYTAYNGTHYLRSNGKTLFLSFSTKKKSIILVYVTIIVELNVLYTVMEKHIVCNTTNKRNTLEDKKVIVY